MGSVGFQRLPGCGAGTVRLGALLAIVATLTLPAAALACQPSDEELGAIRAPVPAAGPGQATIVADPANAGPIKIPRVDAFGSSTVGEVIVVWSPPVRPVDGYRVHRSAGPGEEFRDVSGLLPASHTCYRDRDPTLSPGRTYRYRVRARAPGRCVAFSPVASAMPGPSPGVHYLEGEDAVVAVSDPLQFLSMERQLPGEPFSSSGLLFMRMPRGPARARRIAWLEWCCALETRPDGRSGDRSLELFAIFGRTSASGVFEVEASGGHDGVLTGSASRPSLSAGPHDFSLAGRSDVPWPMVTRIGTLGVEAGRGPEANGGCTTVRMKLTETQEQELRLDVEPELVLDAVVLVER
ncbi:MAG: fibronectin type III domain-containing protein [Candidatus Riflebacteria bacterium]|nr:fibronectin type III domain-containing protein [Candidatus Riflebacteria bacterium]